MSAVSGKVIIRVVTFSSPLCQWMLAKIHFFPPYFLSLFLFAQFDSNGDGQISLPELREAMKKLMGEQVTNREINEILQDADLNGDGLVDFEGGRRLSVPNSASSSASSPLPSSPHLSSLPRVCTDDVSVSSASC